MTVVAIEPIYLDRVAAAAYVLLSESTLEQLVRDGSFPKPRALSGRRVAWLVSELREWAEDCPVSDMLPPPNTGARKGVRTAQGQPSRA